MRSITSGVGLAFLTGFFRVKLFALPLFSVLFLISCGQLDVSSSSKNQSVSVLGYLKVSDPTEMLFWYPSPQKSSPVKSCLIRPGTYGLGYKSWRVDGYILVRFSDEIPGCGEQTSGFIRDTASFDHPESLFVPATEDESLEPSSQHMAGVTTRLVPFYSKRENYELIKSRVLSWFGSTVNGCVLFASSSLRLSGTNIPVTKQLGGDLVTLTTKPFVRHLLENLGWKKIENLDNLEPGDIGVTVDKPGHPTYPSHVFVFISWKDRANRIAIVNDNQGYMISRYLDGRNGDDRTQFAVRPPR